MAKLGHLFIWTIASCVAFFIVGMFQTGRGFTPLNGVPLYRNWTVRSSARVKSEESFPCPPWMPDASLFPKSREGISSKTVRLIHSLMELRRKVPRVTVTDPIRSMVSLLNAKKKYEMCDHVVVEIIARDSTGRVKAHGGDYFRTKLYTPEPYSAVGPDHFFDYDNGTYLALFTLRWAGVVRVGVTLVHPSEAVRVLRKGEKRRFSFRGRFTNVVDGRNYAEDAACGIAPFHPPMCNLSSNHTHGPWFCKEPTTDMLSCSNWTLSFMNTSESSRDLDATLTKTEMAFFRRTKVRLNANRISLNVSQGTIKSNLSSCSYKAVPTTIRTRGFYLNQSWQPFDCRVSRFDNNHTVSCLAGKVLHFYGDSTARQMYAYLKDMIGCQQRTEIHGWFCDGGESNSRTIHFKFHGPPVRGKSVQLAKNLRYIAEEIDDLRGGCPGEIILISLWAHFGVSDGLNGTFYRDRLLAIRGAVERLWKRSPQTRVIIRSANTREHSIGGFILVSSDWVAQQGERTLRNVFSGDERFSFLDVWDMTLVQESKDGIHPLQPTLVQIMNYLLTIVCSSPPEG